MGTFTLKDLPRVEWKPTAKLALARGVASSLVVTPLMVLFAGMPLAYAVPYFLALAITLPIGGPLYLLILKGISAIFAGMGIGIGVLVCNIFLFMVAVLAAIGDPIVYEVNRRYPDLLGVTDFGRFNLQPAIFVLREPGATYV